MVVWGKWDGEAVWSLADLTSPYREEVGELVIRSINSLRANVCPECGKELVWSEPLPIGLLEVEEDKQPLGAGYWRLPDAHSPPGLSDDRIKRLLWAYWLEMIRRFGVGMAQEWAKARFVEVYPGS